MIVLELNVPGDPQTKGSAKGFGFKRADGSVGVNITNDNPKAREWQHRISFFAKQALVGKNVNEPLHCAFAVHAEFRFERPESHLRKTTDPTTGLHLLCKDVDEEHVQKPDIDKLERVVLDALTGVVYFDDAQVIQTRISKRWVQQVGSGVRIRVESRP